MWLWCAKPDDLKGTVYGLNVPVTSLKNLAELGQQLKAFNVPISAAVVHMAMEDDESFPIIKFTIAGWLNEEWGEVAIARNHMKDWTGSSQPATALPAPATTPQPAIAAPTQAAPKVIEGSAKPVSGKTNDVDEALKNWD